MRHTNGSDSTRLSYTYHTAIADREGGREVGKWTSYNWQDMAILDEYVYSTMIVPRNYPLTYTPTFCCHGVAHAGHIRGNKLEKASKENGFLKLISLTPPLLSACTLPRKETEVFVSSSHCQSLHTGPLLGDHGWLP